MSMFKNVKNEDIREIVRIIENVEMLITTRTGVKEVTGRTTAGYLASVLEAVHENFPRTRDYIEQCVGLFRDKDVDNIQ